MELRFWKLFSKSTFLIVHLTNYPLKVQGRCDNLVSCSFSFNKIFQYGKISDKNKLTQYTDQIAALWLKQILYRLNLHFYRLLFFRKESKQCKQWNPKAAIYKLLYKSNLTGVLKKSILRMSCVVLAAAFLRKDIEVDKIVCK